MRKTLFGLLLGTALLLTACGKSSTTETTQSATVKLKDGSTFSGSVTKSDTSAITVKSDSGESRTYPMSQVDSVDYASAPAPTTAPTTTASAPSAPSAPPAAPEAPAPPVHTIPAGTTLRIRTSDTVSARTASSGTTFPAMVTSDVLGTDGLVAIPKGSEATLVVRSAEAQGKIQGQSELVIDIDSVSVAGHRYKLDTSDLVEKGQAGLGKNKRSAEFVGGGAVLGTIIGAVAGGGKGAAIGAGAGAAAGVGTQAVTRGKNVSIPAETILSFRLDAPVHIR